MTPLTVTMIAYRNTPFFWSRIMLNDDGDPIDFTGWSGQMQVRQYEGQPGDPLIDITLITVAPQAGGVLAITIEDESVIDGLPGPDTGGDPKTFFQDVILFKPSGRAFRWVKGPFLVFSGVTD